MLLFLSFEFCFSTEGDDKNKKGTKRKKLPQSSVESEFLPKRRSARVCYMSTELDERKKIREARERKREIGEGMK